jgi:type VI secretion system protein VasD
MLRFSCVFWALVLAACGGAAAPAAAPAPAKPCAPVPLSLAFTATERSNALSGGDGRPVQVRIYQLRGDAHLRTASFEDVWQNEAKALEGDIVASEQQTLFPGEKKTVSVTPKPEAAHLAIVALFREPQGKDWFLTYELAPPKSEPPCATKAEPIPIWLDRMQIQDGAGRESDAGEPGGVSSSGSGKGL